MIRYEIAATNRYRCHIYMQKTPKKFGGPRGYNWGLSDRHYSMNCVSAGMDGAWTTLKECKRRALLAYLFWFTLKLLRKTDDPKKIGDYYDV